MCTENDVNVASFAEEPVLQTEVFKHQLKH